MVKRRWHWIALFIVAVLLLGTLATAYNVVLVKDYRQLLALARSLSHRETDLPKPWIALVVGTIGFAAVLAGLILLFGKLLREMQLNQVQSEFLASVTHALKTPIATLELSSTLLRSGGVDSSEAEKLWEAHGAELERLKEQVETLLEATRWESAALRLNRGPVRIEEWLSGSLPRWARILGPGSELNREGATLGCEANLDLRALNLLTDNLLDNARKFARGQPRVTVHTDFLAPQSPWSRRRWRIEIRDQGWGFEPAEGDRIFRRFYRARTEAPYAIPGTGLGLYLAHQASRALGLRVRGESSGIGQGAVFSVEGPVR